MSPTSRSAIEARQEPTRLPVLVLGRRAASGRRAPCKSFETVTLRHVHSRERLLDLAAFFLHRRVTRLPEAQHRMLEDLHQSDTAWPAARC